MAKKIYGIDPDKKFNNDDVKKAITRCFEEAHENVLKEYDEYNISNMSKEEIDELRTLNIEILINKFLREIGADIKNPKKEDLIELCNKLAKFSKNFRSPKVIKKHYNEIMTLIDKLD